MKKFVFSVLFISFMSLIFVGCFDTKLNYVGSWSNGDGYQIEFNEDNSCILQGFGEISRAELHWVIDSKNEVSISSNMFHGKIEGNELVVTNAGQEICRLTKN